MSGTATQPVADAGGTQMYSAMVVPAGAPDDHLVAILPLEADPLPLSELAAGRLQGLFGQGCAVYMISADEALLHRVLPVVQMLAHTGEGASAQ
jgi:hypothetical protein